MASQPEHKKDGPLSKDGPMWFLLKPNFCLCSKRKRHLFLIRQHKTFGNFQKQKTNERERRKAETKLTSLIEVIIFFKIISVVN